MTSEYLACTLSKLRMADHGNIWSGKLGTLRSFAAEVASAPTFPPPAVEVAQAELALRDGQLELARQGLLGFVGHRCYFATTVP